MASVPPYGTAIAAPVPLAGHMAPKREHSHGADRPVGVALIRVCSISGKTHFFADAGLVLKSFLDRRLLWKFRKMSAQRLREIV